MWVSGIAVTNMSKDTFWTILVWGAIISGGIWFFNSSGSSSKSSFAEQNISGYAREDDPTTTRSSLTGDRDCDDFDYQSEAQEFFEEEGGPDDDPHNLDRDGDGEVCETLP